MSARFYQRSRHCESFNGKLRDECLRQEIFYSLTGHDKGHGRIEERRVSVVRQVDWLDGPRRFPGETRLPGVACLVRVRSRTELKDRCRTETRCYVSSAALTARRAADAVRGHGAIENSLHWVLDVTFADDQSRLRKGHGAHNMAVVRHCALNLACTVAMAARLRISGHASSPRG